MLTLDCVDVVTAKVAFVDSAGGIVHVLPGCSGEGQRIVNSVVNLSLLLVGEAISDRETDVLTNSSTKSDGWHSNCSLRREDDGDEVLGEFHGRGTEESGTIRYKSLAWMSGRIKSRACERQQE